MKKFLLATMAIMLGLSLAAAEGGKSKGKREGKAPGEKRAGGARFNFKEVTKHATKEEAAELKKAAGEFTKAKAEKDEAKIKAAAEARFDAEVAVYGKIIARMETEKVEGAADLKTGLEGYKKNKDRTVANWVRGATAPAKKKAE